MDISTIYQMSERELNRAAANVLSVLNKTDKPKHFEYCGNTDYALELMKFVKGFVAIERVAASSWKIILIDSIAGYHEVFSLDGNLAKAIVRAFLIHFQARSSALTEYRGTLC